MKTVHVDAIQCNEVVGCNFQRKQTFLQFRLNFLENPIAQQFTMQREFWHLYLPSERDTFAARAFNHLIEFERMLLKIVSRDFSLAKQKPRSFVHRDWKPT